MKHSYFNIPGWFNYSETYDMIVDKIPENGKIVEIGSFMGRSTHYLATSLMNANKEQVKIYAIDTFEGSSEHISLKIPRDFSSIFKENLKFFIGREMVIPVQGRSDDPEILNKFKDEDIDYIMVDGAHEHEPVLYDIENWWPKLKPDGVMFGDDFNLASVKEAVKTMMPKLQTPGYSVNGASEQTWFTGKDKTYTKFEKRVPGTNCLT
jgi:predicted O-methyltransferase YrrM